MKSNSPAGGGYQNHMKNIAVINAIGLTSYAGRAIIDGETSLDLAIKFAGVLPDVDSVYIFCRRALQIPQTDSLQVIRHEAWSIKTMLDRMAALSEGFDHVFYFFGDTPLLDYKMAMGMYDKHTKYYAQYSFADGYPIGLSIEIVKRDILPAIAQLAVESDGNPKRDSLFTIIQKDINAFDIETDIAARDQRLLRVTLAADTRRNFSILKSVIGAGVKDAQSVISILDSRPHILRSLPSFFYFQIIDGCPQACTYCPWPNIGGDVLEQRNEMSVDRFSQLLGKIADYADDATIGISLWGEPSLHSSISRIIRSIGEFPLLSVIVETSGIGWQDGVFDEILESTRGGIKWIVSIDALDQALYRSYRGEGYAEANSTALRLLERFPEDTHIQAVRMIQGELKLEEFYRYWKEKTDNIIIQKYDHFCKHLPERKVTDLSPLNRFPCWHLKRDFHVLLDGTVPACKEDLERKHVWGNAFKQPLDEIWKQGQEWYRLHIAGDYPQLCRECDEYYTYNF